jgi:hypothetical protein
MGATVPSVRRGGGIVFTELTAGDDFSTVFSTVIESCFGVTDSITGVALSHAANSNAINDMAYFIIQLLCLA